eukprot:TRINITY_DN8753_c0_g1_i1.p1 TRINITY_DN8753_c0_g1~~TRINITY_DN8753_c0_g1_i1.p1  ORF type:complete len:321 (-),score=75.57 TRINITY_DN8753_c0_g1_i1:790-1752(-)
MSNCFLANSSPFDRANLRTITFTLKAGNITFFLTTTSKGLLVSRHGREMEGVVEAWVKLLTENLEVLSTPIPRYLNFSVVDFGHAFFVASDLKHANPDSSRLPFAIAFFTFVVACVGGSTTTAIIIGLPPNWLTKDELCFWLLIAFLLVHYVPGDLLYNVLFKNHAVRPLLWTLEGISWGYSCAFGGVDFTRSIRPNSYVLAFMGGVLGGCGGGLVVQAFSLNGQWTFGVPTAFKTPSSRLVGSAFLSLCYLALKVLLPLLPASSIPPLVSTYTADKHHKLMMALLGIAVMFTQQFYEFAKKQVKAAAASASTSEKQKTQ